MNNWNISVLSAYDPRHPEYTIQDLKIFNITLSTQEMKALDQVPSPCCCLCSPSLLPWL